MQAVGDVSFGGASIEVKEEQREVGEQIFITAFDALADDMVSYTAEGLQRHDFLHAKIGRASCRERVSIDV